MQPTASVRLQLIRAFPVRSSALLACLLVLPTVASAQRPTEKAGPLPVRSAFDLAANPIVRSHVNEVDCGMVYDGPICYDHFAGLRWPGPDGHTHIWLSGAQITGMVPVRSDCTIADRFSTTQADCFAWSGDTAGASFVSLSQLGLHSRNVAGFFDSHHEPWPETPPSAEVPVARALIRDSSIFHPDLLGRRHASDQDTWVAYWDADPAHETGGRTHPLGVLIEQRSLAWRQPFGAEATIFFVFRITNITDNAVFQQQSEEHHFGGEDRLPDAGWRLDSLYFTYAADIDVGLSYALNHLTTVLPFDMMVGYHAEFDQPTLEFPLAQFHPPFLMRSPAIPGIMFLRTAEGSGTGEMGMTRMNSYTGGGAFPQPGDMGRAWRHASGRLDPQRGDPPCSYFDGVDRRWCFLNQQTSDVRGSISTGPFSLGPGESETIVLAMMVGAAVETPLITPGRGNFTAPGLPSETPGCGGDPIRPIEAAAGWVSTSECPPAGGTVDLREVEVVPGSLLYKAQVAQVIVDNRFRMPQPPAAPEFQVIAGDDRVTIVWEPSSTEQTGDPYHAIAADASSVLHDPNFRLHDVEGYRIYRGTSPDDMELIAQFDRDDSFFVDARCITDPAHVRGTPCTSTRELPINSELIQYTTVPDADGTPVVVAADTALAEDIRDGRAFALDDTGVPFTFDDTNVQPGQRYYYRITTFDINSLHSSASSLESGSVAKSAMGGFASGRHLDRIHTVPDPYYGVSTFDPSPTAKRLRFVNLPSRATIRIYSLSGVLVDIIDHDDASGTGEAEWNLASRNNYRVASGVYLYHVSMPGGRQHVGRFTVITPGR